MQIVITSTDERLLLAGVPVQRWAGRTAGGIDCEVYVHRVAVRDGQDTAAFEAELTAAAPPASLPASAVQAPGPEDPRFAAYLAAMRRTGTHPVHVETTIADLLVLVSTLQLALRHPAFPPRVRGQVEAFLDVALAGVALHDPLLAEVGWLGNDPAYDVPVPPAEGG